MAYSGTHTTSPSWVTGQLDLPIHVPLQTPFEAHQYDPWQVVAVTLTHPEP